MDLYKKHLDDRKKLASQMSSEFISTFDIFKLSIGPSSSHTMGPMLAAADFIKLLLSERATAGRLCVHLYGSLALTGRGHQTDKAILLGLQGIQPSTLKQEHILDLKSRLERHDLFKVNGMSDVKFEPAQDIHFHANEWLSEHPNGLRFELTTENQILISRTYFSIGGGFIKTKDEFYLSKINDAIATQVPLPYRNADELLSLTEKLSISIDQIVFQNELKFRSEKTINSLINELVSAMHECVERGLVASNTLPGSLKLNRRAPAIHQSLRNPNRENLPETSDWLSLYALAVNEENAAGHQVVTAPTNGAAGVVPAILEYLITHLGFNDFESKKRFLFTASAFGLILKTNASISGAEAGCQAEIGGAAAMAAAGLCAVLGGSPKQIENAAEIALEHHLGLTCDPVQGLVQIPCIERNAFGATKAYLAAKLALYGDGTHRVSFDQCVASLKQIGEDMSTKYKETSTGGLAVNVTSC